MRVCIGYSPDPFLKLIPFDVRWFFVTRQLYLIAILIAFLLFLWESLRGVQTPLLRWGLSLAFMTSLRIATVTMIPLCRSTLQPGGTPPLGRPDMLNLHYFSIPFRAFALNDLVYSGHTAVFILVFLSSGTWNRKGRWAVALFLMVMMYALIGTRGHYSVDILLAFPCATFADRLAVAALRFARKLSGSDAHGNLMAIATPATG
jgi:PAP2 superfamily C-terminal